MAFHTQQGWLFKKGGSSKVCFFLSPTRALEKTFKGTAPTASLCVFSSLPFPPHPPLALPHHPTAPAQTSRKRWFGLDGSVLRWYEPGWFTMNPVDGKLKGEVDVSGGSVGYCQREEGALPSSAISVVAASRTLQFHAGSKTELDSWLSAGRGAVAAGAGGGRGGGGGAPGGGGVRGERQQA